MKLYKNNYNERNQDQEGNKQNYTMKL